MTQTGRHAWHALSGEETLRALGSDAEVGLTEEEAARRLEQVGRNEMAVQRGPGPLARFIQQLNNPLIYILMVAGLVTSFMPDHRIEAGVIFGVVIVMAVFGFIQESRAEAAIESLGRLLAPSARTLRQGEQRTVEASQLVPGDIVRVESGDRVPADLRCLRSRNLHVDESMLTGESLPVAKETGPLDEALSVPDRKNMMYSGALVTAGEGRAVVVATGSHTELGRISTLVAGARRLETPLLRRIAKFSKSLSWAILGLAVATFSIGLLTGVHWTDMFIAAVAIAVAAIPEGLPAALTIILASGVSRMAARNALIRRLPAVEALGSTTVICSDKTGTLTKNEMTVTAIYAGGETFSVSGSGYQPKGEIAREGAPLDLDAQAALRATIIGGVLCNGSNLRQQDGRWTVEGDPTEVALLAVAHKAGFDPEQLRQTAEEMDVVPFESEHKYMASLHKWRDGRRVIHVKGAAEAVARMCDDCLDADGNRKPLNAKRLLGIANDFAADGLRVLGFAVKEAPEDQDLLRHEDLEQGLVFTGFQAMLDPPREEAVAAVKAARRAGIQVKMVTGDHPITARTIARQVAIGDDEVNVLTGSEMEAVSDEDLPGLAERTHVFARVTPEQKLRLVEALQSIGHVVAMTGDGVNDAPALKRADIGVAMGIMGTQAARDAAAMVLTDDNFASIEAAVEEGRSTYDNLRKFITWTLPMNGAESLLLVVAIVLSLELPLEPVHVLWINLVTAPALGSMLAFEPREPDVMARPARDPEEPVLTLVHLVRIAYVSALATLAGYLLFFWKMDRGHDIVGARTLVTTAIVMIELVYLFNCRSLRHSAFHTGFFSNRYAFLGAFTMILLQLGFVYLPPLQLVFRTAPLTLLGWLEVAVASSFVFAVVETEKWVRRRWRPVTPAEAS